MATTVACASCRKRIVVQDALLGKRVKCSACGNVFSVPLRPDDVAPAAAPSADLASMDDDEVEVLPGSDQAGEAANAASEPTPRAADPPSDAEPDDDSGWGENVLKTQDVPQPMRNQILKILNDREHITWATRARMDMLLASARTAKIVGFVMLGVAAVLVVVCVGIFVLPLVLWLFSVVSTEMALGIGAITVLVLVVGLVILLALVTVGVGFIRLPRRMQQNEKTRPCYAIAGRRLIVHPGIGMDMPMPKWLSAIAGFVAKSFRKKTKAAVGVTGYVYADLAKMHRIETPKFPGAGDIVLGLNDLEQSTLYRMAGIDNVRQVERVIREKVLHPAVDELLAGKRSIAELRRGSSGILKDQGDAFESTVLPPERGVKDWMSKTQSTGKIAKIDAAIAAALDEAGDAVRKRVKAELTDGEEILWIDRPAAQTKGRGIIGAMVSNKVRKEPVYELYAMTNRRVLLWASKDTSIDVGSDTHHYGRTGDMSQRGPLSYYSTDLTGVGLEEDERIEHGGSIVIKSVRVTIITTKEEKKRRAHGPVTFKTTRKYETHCFGILRVRNVHAVTRLLYDRLIAPCR